MKTFIETVIAKEREFVSRFQSVEGLTDEQIDRLFDYYAERVQKDGQRNNVVY